MDIRGFFGGGSAKKAPKQEEVAAASKAHQKSPLVKKKRIQEEEIVLMDSDDDAFQQPSSSTERRRLKKVSEVKAAPPMASPDASRKRKVDEIVQRVDAKTSVGSVEDVSSESKESSPVKKLKADVQLKKMSFGGSVTSSSTKKTEVTGGAAAFFREPVIAAPTTPAKSSSKVKSESTPEQVGRSPLTRSQSNAGVDFSPSKSPKMPTLSRSRTAPPPAASPSSSCAPIGKAGCFDGLKFVVTGVMDETGREAIETMILEYGGKLASSVSGRTNYLVSGSVLEDGRPVHESLKYKEALAKKVTILTERKFLSLVKERESELSLKSPPSGTSSGANPKATVRPPAPLSSKVAGLQSRPVAEVENVSLDDLLWVDKYKPTRVEDIIGSNETVSKLMNWLKRWDDMHIKKTFKPAFTKENPGAKAVLISGPPGIGKTTVATIVAKSLGFQVLELNASDTRSKRSIQEELSDVVLSRSIASSGGVQKRVVVMDEVDGMGGSDRGGVAELIKVIKASKSPIICICNDRQSVKIRSLANSCFDIRVKRPTKTQIANRLVRIAALEGLRVEPNAAEMLVEQTGNDIRQVVNAMQMWRAQSNSLSFMDVKQTGQRIEKDKMLRNSPFDACGMILGGSRESLDDRYNVFFVDYSLVPLLIQQNYIDSSKNGIFKSPGLSEDQKMSRLAEAADALCDMDLVGSSIMGADQHWELLPVQAAAAANVGAKVQGFQSFPTFPQWLGKYSTTGKSKRLVKELVVHTAMSITQGFTAMRLEYVPYLRQRLLHPLLKNGSDGAAEVVAMLDEYGLSKDDFMETMKDFQFIAEKDASFTDQYELLDSKVKAALTRLYNSTEHRSQALVDEQAGLGSRGRGGGSGGGGTKTNNEFVADEDDDVLESLDTAETNDNEEDGGGSADISAFMKKSGAKRKEAGGASSGKGKGSAKAPPSKKTKV